MGLRDLGLEPEYRSSDGSLVARFYARCLGESERYDRAVGYFTSGSLALAARGLPAFIAAGGTMRLIASPQLSEDDLKAIETGYEARTDAVARALIRAFDHAIPTEIEAEHLGFLAWLIAEDRLEIKIAFRRTVETGIYHEKIGVFRDDNADSVAFTGSANETFGGFVGNFESIDVYRSWAEWDRVKRKSAAFEALWANETNGLEVIDLPGIARERLITYRPATKNRQQAATPTAYVTDDRMRPFTGLDPRDYQLAAVDAWLSQGRGILEMATGTGKTITSLLAATRALADSRRSIVVVAAPFIHLVDQWVDECKSFGAMPIACYGSWRRWHPELTSELRDLEIGLTSQVVVVTTHSSLMNRQLLRAIGSTSGNAELMLIGDEVHHLGTEAGASAVEALEPRYVLGLSATPKRWLDDEGDGRLEDAFGPVVYSFGLLEAIAGRFLTPYDYHPVLVDLTEAEFRDYTVLSLQVARAMREGNQELLGHLLRRRAEILNSASGKLEALANLVRPLRNIDHALVYTNPSRLHDVTALLGHDIGLRVHQFTYRESRTDRVNLLRQFDDGLLQALVAIRCLDEGVDVPATRTAFITASSSNPREFIQRRGRILRRSPGKKAAVIYDLVTVPPAEMARDESTWGSERSILRKEMARFAEFADAARNAHQARAEIIDLQDRYQLLDM